MATSLSVSYDDLRGAAARLEVTKESIIAALEQARSLIGDLVGQGFVTQHASVRFQSASERFVVGSRQAMEGLTELGRYLTQASAALEQADQDLASRIG